MVNVFRLFFLVVESGRDRRPFRASQNAIFQTNDVSVAREETLVRENNDDSVCIVVRCIKGSRQSCDFEVLDVIPIRYTLRMLLF